MINILQFVNHWTSVIIVGAANREKCPLYKKHTDGVRKNILG